MKVMVTLTGPFEGTDPDSGERRTYTIGDPDPAELPREVAWAAYHQVARMLDVDPLPLVEDDVQFAKRLAGETAAQHPDIIGLWEDGA